MLNLKTCSFRRNNKTPSSSKNTNIIHEYICFFVWNILSPSNKTTAQTVTELWHHLSSLTFLFLRCAEVQLNIFFWDTKMEINCLSWGRNYQLLHQLNIVHFLLPLNLHLGHTDRPRPTSGCLKCVLRVTVGSNGLKFGLNKQSKCV